MESQLPSSEALSDASAEAPITVESPATHRADSPWFAVIGVLLMIGAGIAWFAWKDQPVPGLLLALAASLILLRTPEPPSPSARKTISRCISPFSLRENRQGMRAIPGARRMLLLVPGIGLSLLVAERAMQSPPGKVWWLLLGWILSALLVFLAFVPLPAIRAWIRHVRDSLRAERREWLFVLGLMIVAFAIRVSVLGSFPPVMLEDEGFFASQAADLRTVDAWEFSPFGYDFRYHPLLYHTFEAISIQFLGQTLEAARLPSVLIGILAVPGLYLAARRMFDRRVAVVAALFLVTFPQHVHFSRLALNQPMDPTLVIWTFAFLVGALKRQDRVEYGLAGLMLGVSQYGFSSARLIPLLVLAYVGLYFLRRRAALRTGWPGLVLMALVSLVLVWPQGRSLLQTGDMLAPRIGFIGIWQPIPRTGFIPGTQGDQMLGYWINQVSRPFLAFVQVRDNATFYGNFDPYLGWIASVPFLLGLVCAIRRRKDPNYATLLVWWLAVVVLGGVAVIDPPEFQRFVIAIPVLSILVGLGLIFAADVLSWLSKRLTPDQPVSWRAEYWGTPVLLVVLLAVFNLTTYVFGYATSDATRPNALTVFWNEVAVEVLPSLPDYKILFVSNLPPYLNLSDTGILHYLSPHSTRVRYSGSLEDLPGVLAAYSGKQAVIVAGGASFVEAAISQLNEVPTLPRRLALFMQPGNVRLAVIYESAPE